MRRAILLVAWATLQAAEPPPEFRRTATEKHEPGDMVVERHRSADNRTEQVWLASAKAPDRRHLLHVHHRQATVLFSRDEAWLALADHAGSAGSSLLLFQRDGPPAYRQVADLTGPAWDFFDQRNRFRSRDSFHHRYIDAVHWLDGEPAMLLIRLHGYGEGVEAVWHCLCDVENRTFATDLDAANRARTKLGRESRGDP